MPFAYDQRERLADFIVRNEKEAQFKTVDGYLFKMVQTSVGYYRIECHNVDGTFSHVVDSGSKDYVQGIWGKI